MSIKFLNTNYTLSPQRMYENPRQKSVEKDDNAKKQDVLKKKDIFHNSPLRYFGYSDDIGAAIRVVCNNSKNPLIKNLPKISYIPAGVYIAADVASTYNKAKEEDGKKMALKKAFGETVFQGLTNILFPILIVGAAQKTLGKGFDKFIPKLKQEFSANGEKIVNRSRDIALALGGLGTLFAVSKPVDKFSDKIIIDKIINPVLGTNDINNKEYKGKINSKLNTTQG